MDWKNPEILSAAVCVNPGKYEQQLIFGLAGQLKRPMLQWIVPTTLPTPSREGHFMCAVAWGQGIRSGPRGKKKEKKKTWLKSLTSPLCGPDLCRPTDLDSEMSRSEPECWKLQRPFRQESNNWFKKIQNPPSLSLSLSFSLSISFCLLLSLSLSLSEPSVSADTVAFLLLKKAPSNIGTPMISGLMRPLLYRPPSGSAHGGWWSEFWCFTPGVKHKRCWQPKTCQLFLFNCPPSRFVKNKDGGHSNGSQENGVSLLITGACVPHAVLCFLG